MKYSHLLAWTWISSLPGSSQINKGFRLRIKHLKTRLKLGSVQWQSISRDWWVKPCKFSSSDTVKLLLIHALSMLPLSICSAKSLRLMNSGKVSDRCTNQVTLVKLSKSYSWQQNLAKTKFKAWTMRLRSWWLRGRLTWKTAKSSPNRRNMSMLKSLSWP